MEKNIFENITKSLNSTLTDSDTLEKVLGGTGGAILGILTLVGIVYKAYKKWYSEDQDLDENKENDINDRVDKNKNDLKNQTNETEILRETIRKNKNSRKETEYNLQDIIRQNKESQSLQMEQMNNGFNLNMREMKKEMVNLETQVFNNSTIVNVNAKKISKLDLE